jgi:GNAT superfamily N-acetyltransferase
MIPLVLSPTVCSTDRLDAFWRLAAKGREVATEGLKARIAAAHRLTFLIDRSTVIGIAALKNPHGDYRDRIFRKANLVHEGSGFPLELGWVYVEPEYRGKGYSNTLVSATMAVACGRGTYATTSTMNVAMHHALLRANFDLRGEPFASVRAGVQLVLFCHPGAQPSR